MHDFIETANIDLPAQIKANTKDNQFFYQQIN